MQTFLSISIKSILLDFAGLAVSCFFPFFANLFSKRPPVRIEGRTRRASVIAASSLAGMALPFGSFGAVPVVAAGWLAGLDLQLMLPLLVSNLLFNLSIPATSLVFVWNGNIIRIVVAFIAGVTAGMLFWGRKPENFTFRSNPFHKLFINQKNTKNYFIILKEYALATWPYIVAAALLKAFFSADLLYWLQNAFYSTGTGMTAIRFFAKLNVIDNAFFATAMVIFERIMDFSCLAAFAMLLRAKSFIRIYALYTAIALLMSITIFIR